MKKTSKRAGKNKTLLVSALCIISLAFLYYLLFMNHQVSGFIQKVSTQRSSVPAKAYKSLDKNLNLVVNAENPAEEADKLNLLVKDNQLAVLIEANNKSFVFSQEYGKQDLRYGNYIQAYINFGKLEELAKNEKIVSIKAPEKSIRKPTKYKQVDFK